MMMRILLYIMFGLTLFIEACTATSLVVPPSPESSKERSTAVVAAPKIDNPEEVYISTLAYIRQGEIEKAQTLLEKLAASYQEEAAIYNGLGVLYKKGGMLDRAIENYKKAIELRDPYVEAHYNLALVYREMGMFSKAEAEYREAIAEDPNFAPAHYNLGILYDIYMNRPSDALNHYVIYKNLSGATDKLDVWISDLEQNQSVSGVARPAGGPP